MIDYNRQGYNMIDYNNRYVSFIFFLFSICSVALYCTIRPIPARVVVCLTEEIEPDPKLSFLSLLFVAQHRFSFLLNQFPVCSSIFPLAT